MKHKTPLRHFSQNYQQFFRVGILTILLGFTFVAHAQEISVVQQPGGFSSSLWQQTGSAFVNSSGITLTNATSSSAQTGTAYFKQRIYLDDDRSFSTHFQFQISGSGSVSPRDSGADGLCFVLQTTSNTAGSSGGGIGYAGVSPSVAVEFDTYFNWAGEEPAEAGVSFRSGANHVAIVKDGNISKDYDHLDFEYIDIDGTPGADTNNPLESGTWSVWVDYNGATNQFEVRYVKDSTSRPGSANLSYNIDLETKFADQAIFMGFSSATGNAWATHKIVKCLFENSYASSGLSSSGSYSQATPPAAPDDQMLNSAVGSAVTLTAVSSSPGVDNYLWFDSQTSQNPVATGSTYTTPILFSNTIYYITSVNSTSGLQSTSRGIIDITVAASNPPNPALNPLPSTNAMDIAPGEGLSWSPPTAGEPPTGYIIYFGSDNPPTNIHNGTDNGNLTSFSVLCDANTQYFWKVVPYNADGMCATAPVWNFTRNDSTVQNKVSRFSAAPLAGIPGTTVRFMNDCGAHVNRFIWIYGDGAIAGYRHGLTASEKVHPEHIYAEAGVYTVSLVARGWQGNPPDTLVIPDLLYINEDYAPLAITDSSESHPGYGWGKIIDNDVFTTNGKLVADLPDVSCAFMFADTSVRNVDRVRLFTDDIYLTNFAGHLTQEFEVWCSLDQVSWTKAFGGTIPWENRGSFTDFTFDAVTARYVKLNLTVPHNPNATTIQLSEFQVFGAKNADMTLDKNNLTENAPVTEFQLEQNYPNPFNPSTTINFALPEAGHVSLQVYNVTGQLVTELVNDKMESGRHQVVFDAAHLPTGIYFCSMKAANYNYVTRMILMK